MSSANLPLVLSVKEPVDRFSVGRSPVISVNLNIVCNEGTPPALKHPLAARRLTGLIQAGSSA